MRLKDKVMIVTGGASGIGRAAAMACAREGAKTVIMDVSEADGFETEKQLRQDGAEGVFLKSDVTAESDWTRVTDFVQSRFGRLDILFNNAGANLVKPVTEITEQEWDQLMALNLKGVFFGVKHGIPLMLKSGGGSIISTASTFGLIGNPGMSAYCASKGAIIALTRQLALDYGKHNIRVNCICPGMTLTPRIGKYIERGIAKPEAMIARVPLGRLAQPEDIGKVVLFLASDDASYITGTVQVVDGGRLTQ